MAISWKHEIKLAGLFEIGNVLISHFGYAAIAATAYLFKLAIAATLASYSAFLCATLVGGLITYFPARAVLWALQSMGAGENIAELGGMLVQFGLSPMVGAYILNLALGWSLPLMPMLAVGGVGLLVGVAVVLMMAACCSDNHSSKSSANRGYQRNSLLASPRTDKGSDESVVSQYVSEVAATQLAF